MPEISAKFPREWLEFEDPNNSKQLIRCDITWLTSSWNCIYGSGCKGIEADKPNAGCCSDGAYYSSSDDEKRVKKAAARLTPDIWQFHPSAKGRGKLSISEIGLDGDRKTRRVEDSCIFLNRNGFEGGMGCALHLLSLREGSEFYETKPDACWQLPILRTFEEHLIGDEHVSVTVIGEYERMAWGEGGADFDWYCTSNTEAHTAENPVYLTHAKELIQLIGVDCYRILSAHCDKRMKLRSSAKKKLLPLIPVHPATLAAKG